jgi:hypothetical protein
MSLYCSDSFSLFLSRCFARVFSTYIQMKYLKFLIESIESIENNKKIAKLNRKYERTRKRNEKEREKKEQKIFYSHSPNPSFVFSSFYSLSLIYFNIFLLLFRAQSYIHVFAVCLSSLPFFFFFFFFFEKRIFICMELKTILHNKRI